MLLGEFIFTIFINNIVFIKYQNLFIYKYFKKLFDINIKIFYQKFHIIFIFIIILRKINNKFYTIYKYINIDISILKK